MEQRKSQLIREILFRLKIKEKDITLIDDYLEKSKNTKYLLKI